MSINFFFLVPTLNSSACLPRLIGSLKKQTYLNWRVLFVDGESESKHRNWLIDFCSNEEKFSWIEQKNKKGIYTAMNYGFQKVKQDEWLLFWGSDDWAENQNILKDLNKTINDLSIKDEIPDLLISQATYINNIKREIRKTKFKKILNYKLSLFLGESPPHQASVFGPGTRKINQEYSDKYILASDLDYFCKLACVKKLKVGLHKKSIVKLGSGGISQRKNLLRLKEVIIIYKKYFGITFFVPIALRYLKRFISLII